jgi:predicted DNA-binding transcriptional regulator AlpA
MLTRAEVMEFLGISMKTVYNLIERGELPAPVKWDNQAARWHRSAFEALKARREQATPAPSPESRKGSQRVESNGQVEEHEPLPRPDVGDVGVKQFSPQAVDQQRALHDELVEKLEKRFAPHLAARRDDQGQPVRRIAIVDGVVWVDGC